MKALIVHDRQDVALEVAEILKSVGVTPECIRFAEDGVSTRTLLQNELFDLAIVDLTLPHIKNKTEPNYSTAEELLLEIFTSDALNVPGDLIGLTQDPEALENINSEIGPHLMAIVHEDKDGAWRKRLKDRIIYVTRASNSRLRSINQQHDYDVAILTALDKEFSPYADIFELSDLKYFDGVKTFLFQDKMGMVRKGVGCAIGRAGQAPSASMTQSLLGQFRPSLCLMSGFCGGFKDKTNEGDVLFAESVVDWDFGKWKGVGETAVFVPRPEPICIRDEKIHTIVRSSILSRLKHHDTIVDQLVKMSDGRLTAINMVLGPIASGSAVVADATIIPRIQNINDAILGVDMEAFGFYYAAKYTRVARPNFLMIKAVADFCDREKHDKNHIACSYLSAKIVEDLICSRYDFD